jgi:hypothetical protein
MTKRKPRPPEYLIGGRADGIPIIRFKKKQLQLGVRTEMEHTNNPRIAVEIAKDHLKEYPNYYTYLLRMEARLARRKNAKRNRMVRP